MISYIRGPLVEKLEDSVVVEAGNIGYRIYVPALIGEALPPIGEEVRLYTHFQVREDAMVLYGFLSRNDLAMFRMLLGVNGVGPRSALGMFSGLTPDEVRIAIVSEDVKTLTKAPGIGTKTARRIILDLKDKISTEDLVPEEIKEGGPAAAFSTGGAAGEAVEALTALGYSSQEAVRAVKQVELREDMTAEDVLKGALKHLAFI